MSKFVETVLAQLNQPEAQAQQESVENFVAEAIIETELQIGNYEAQLKKDELQLKKAKNALTKATEALEKAKFTQCKDYDSYIELRNDKEEEQYNAQSNVNNAENEIVSTKAQIEKFQAILADLQS